ncbi:MAG: nucleotide sugar dehydrogenase [Oscillospiraceae bacterium]|nr:nucleotide sugar dehydrogenase [Oscillospiraceae bacterium]
MAPEYNTLYDRLIRGEEKLALVGLGYVGMPIAVEFAKHVKVIGFNHNEYRIRQYKSGIDPTNEVGNEVISKTTVDFTSDEKRLSEARFIIVAVPTPVKDDNNPDLEPVENASRIVGRNMVPGTIVVYESTVYPGVTEDICIPILERESGLKCGEDFKIGYSPERINPGDRVHTLTSIRKVVSGMDEESADQIQKIYDIVIKAGTFRVSNIKTAEAVKVIENSQRDINIAFMNEIAMICDRMDIDTDEVLAGMNTKWNALGFKPGLVGGHCIGVDPYYLTNVAEKLGYHSQIILNGRKVNDSMGAYVADAAIKQMIEAGKAPKKAKVVILGITFKENCPDTRNSKVYDVIKRLKEYDIDPLVTDPWADPAIARHEYGVDLIPFEEVRDADCVIVAVGHNEFRSLSMLKLKEFFKPELKDDEKVLIDVKSLYRMDELRASGMRFWRL